MEIIINPEAYTNGKLFGFREIKSFESQDFDKFKKCLEQIKKAFPLIYYSLDEIDRMEFVSDLGDNLRDLINLQRLTKFKIECENLRAEFLDFHKFYNLEQKEIKFFQCSVHNLTALAFMTGTTVSASNIVNEHYIDRIDKYLIKFLEVNDQNLYMLSGQFDNKLKHLTKIIVQLYLVAIGCDDQNKFMNLRLDVNEMFRQLDEYPNYIKDPNNGHSKENLKIFAEHCILGLKSSIAMLNFFSIKIMNSPLANDFENTIAGFGKIKIFKKVELGLIEEKKDEKDQPKIFAEFGFKVFDYYFQERDIKESSLTDIAYVFNQLKNYNLIHDTVEQRGFKKYLLDYYDIDVAKFPAFKKDKNKFNVFKHAISLYANGKKKL